MPQTFSDVVPGGFQSAVVYSGSPSGEDDVRDGPASGCSESVFL